MPAAYGLLGAGVALGGVLAMGGVRAQQREDNAVPRPQNQRDTGVRRFDGDFQPPRGGQPQMMPPMGGGGMFPTGGGAGTPGAIATADSAGGVVYILRGDTLYQVEANGLKMRAQLQLPAPQPMMRPVRPQIGAPDPVNPPTATSATP